MGTVRTTLDSSDSSHYIRDIGHLRSEFLPKDRLDLHPKSNCLGPGTSPKVDISPAETLFLLDICLQPRTMSKSDGQTFDHQGQSCWHRFAKSGVTTFTIEHSTSLQIILRI